MLLLASASSCAQRVTFVAQTVTKTLSCGAATGYSYAVQITIAAQTSTSTDQTNFPMYFAGGNYFAGIAHSGYAAKSDGSDVVFCTAQSAGSILPYELVAGTYSGTTGAGEWWVRVPTISHSSAQTIYALVGNAGGTDHSAVATVWAAYTGVWHFGTSSTLSLTDSTGNNTLTNVSNLATAAAGPHDGAAHFVNASAAYMTASSTLAVNPITWEAWVNPSSYIQYQAIIGNRSTSGYLMFNDNGTAGELDCQVGNNGTYQTLTGGSGSGGAVLPLSTWTLASCSFDGTNLKDYINGVLDTHPNVNGSAVIGTSPAPSDFAIAALSSTSSSPYTFNGSIAEVRVSGLRTADWLLDEYNNVHAPTTFYATYKSNRLSRRPMMGWDSWRPYGTTTTEALVKANADLIVSNGMKAAGYQYVNPTDNWATGRSAGVLTTDASKYPDGMAALDAYIHADGLLVGTYLAPGTTGCNAFPGSQGYETQDANQIAGFGADYLMYDNCTSWANDAAAQTAYATMMFALQASGRPIAYLVALGMTPLENNSEQWAGLVGGNAAWTYQDLGAAVGSAYPVSWASTMTILDGQYGLEVYAQPGRWNVPDFLAVGNGVLTDTEGQSNFSLWAILASPLWASVDLTAATTATITTLTNTDVIAVDQDALGIQGKRVSQVACGSANCEVYARQLSSNAWAVVLFNRSSTSQSISATWSMFGETGPYTTTRDLWAHSSLGTLSSGYTATVPSHGVAMIRVAP
jgi:alpha-galactosidase